MPTTSISESKESRRLFLIGNGPSLASTDLSCLRGEFAWAMNRIHLLYDRTTWRPTRWWWSDHPQYRWQLEEIFWYVRTFDHECWVRDDVGEMLTGAYRPFGDAFDFFPCLPSHAHAWRRCKHTGVTADDERWPDRWHLGDGTLCKLGSGLHALVQEAVLEGYNPLILVGCDLGFKPGHGETHFAPDYYPSGQITTPGGADERNRTLLAMHQIIKRECDARGIEVLNATIGGELEVYPRVSLESILA